jgi:hypothetical protein
MLLRYINIPILLVSALLSVACAKPPVHRAVSMDSSSPPSMASQTGDRHVLAGEWEYIDVTGAAVLLTLDEQGSGHYDWKDGRFETLTLIDHTWNGMWFQEENDQDGGFTVEFSPDFSEGEGQWWHSRIGTDYAPTQKGGTFHLSKKPTTMSHNDTPSAPTSDRQGK